MRRVLALTIVCVLVVGSSPLASAALLGHWELNETVNPSGNRTAVDSSPSGLNGTYQPLGGPGPVVGVPGANAATGTAADFNGGADEVYLASPAALKMGNDFSITAWVSPDRTSGIQRIFSQYPGGSIGYGFGLTGNDLRFTTYSIQDYNTNTIDLPTGEWTHVGVTFDAANDATFYVNGIPRQTIAGGAPANIGNNNFFIGSYGTGERLDGRIDDVQVHSGVLTQSQIQQIAGTTKVGHWRLDETANPSGNTVAVDSTASALNGIYQPRGGPGPVLGLAGAALDTGTAASFNGSNDEVYLASPEALKMGNDFTIAAWINTDVTTAGRTQRVFSQYPAGSVGYGFGLLGDELKFTTYGRQDYVTSGIDIPTNQWMHVAVAMDAANDATFYVNGVPRQTIAGANPANIGNNNFFIGRTGGGEPFDGRLDDVQVYRGTLSQTQIQSLVGPVLLGHWQLDETANPSGNTQAIDSSGNGLNGIYQPRGGPGPIVGVSGATPTTGTAADFNGGADEVYLASPAALKMGNNFTISAWVNPDDTDGVQRIFSQYPGGSIGYGFGLTGNDLRFTTYGIQDYNTNTINMPTDHWSHVAVTFDENNDATFFVNGQPRQTIAGASPANIGNNNFFIGAHGTGERLNGQIDDVRVYRGTLTQPQIQQLSGKVLIGHWQLDEMTNPSGNTQALDSSGNNLHGIYQPLGGPGPVVGVTGARPNTGSAADFNGANDEIYLGSPGDLKMGNNFTIAAWINPDDTAGVQRIFAQYRGGSVGYGFGLVGDDLRFTTWGIQDYNTNTINLPTDQWTHVAVAFDENNDATFFVNGQPRQTIAGGAPARIGNNNFFIGREGTIEPFDGRIDDVRVYTGTLNSADITAFTGPILIGHWKLDETVNPSGFTTAADSSGYGLDGIYQPRGGPGPIVGVPGAGPNTGTAADFNGGPDEIYLASPGDLKMPNNFSIAAWIKPDDTDGVQRIFSQYPAGGVGYGFGLVGDELRFTTYSIQDYNTSGVDIPVGDWSHVAVVFDPNNDAHFYVDGILVQTIAGGAAANIGNNNFFIGSFGTGERFNGQIDDVMVFSGMLTAEDLQEIIRIARIPEPATFALVGLGLLALRRRSRRRR